MLIREVALDLTNFVLSNVNDAISFKPQLCYQVPAQDYVELRERYIAFTGTSMRKNKSKLYFLPTNISDELQQLNPSIPDSAKRVARDGHVYYKNRLITELDYENVKRVELACAYIAYATVNKAACVEVTEHDDRSGSNSSSSAGYDQPETDPDVESEKLSPAESTALALRRGGVIGFRELGYLVAITPWHFHRVFKVITGLTIREYGQLCTEFVKKNRDIMSACKRKIEDLKSQGHSYHCFEEPNFLKDGSLCYEPTTNVVLLPEYFIDPNKSKEHKKKQKEAKTSDGKCTQRVEARKRRSSVMSGRIRRASQTSISSNTSIQEALHGGEVGYPSTPQLSPTDHGGHSSGHSVSASPVLGGYNAIDFSAPNMEGSLSRSQFSGRSRKGSLVTNLLSSAPAGVAVSGKILKPKAVPHGSNGNNNYMRHMSEPSLAITARGLENLPLDTGSKVPVGGVTTVTDATNVSAQTALSPQIDFKFDIFGTHGSAKGLNNTSVTTANDILDDEDPYSTVTSLGITEGSCLKTSESELQGSENSRGSHLGENTSSSLNSSDKKAYSLATPAANSSSGETYVQTHSRHHGSPRNNEFEAESEANMLLDLNAVPDEVVLTESYSVFEPKFDNLHSGDSFTSIPDYAISSMSGEHQTSSSQTQQVPSQFLQQQHQQQQQRLQQQQQLELQEERQQHQQHKEQQQQEQDTLQSLSNSFDAYARNRMNSVAPEMDELDRMFLSGYDGSSAFVPHLSADDGDNLTSTINFASQPSTRDNTMATATTTDTSASTRNFVDKNDMAAYTNLGFGTLSPCASPTAVDFEATLSTNQPSIEALISSGHDDIIGNQLGFTPQVTNQ